MSSSPVIRSASPEDAPAIRRLLAAQGLDVDDDVFTSDPGTRHVLVLDAPDGGLAAAALLVLEGSRAHLAQLAIAPAFEGRGLEDRLISVIEAIARAYGVTTLDIPGRHAA